MSQTSPEHHPWMDFPITKLYTAGRVLIPAEGGKISRAAVRLEAALETLNREVAHAGDPDLLTAMLSIGDATVRTMRQGVVALDNGAESVLRSADLLRRSDEEAKAHYDKLRTKASGLDLTPLGRHHVPRHELPTSLPEPLATPGAPGLPGGPTTVPGSPDVTPTRIGRGDLDPTLTPRVQSTPAPVDPETDQQQRETTERRDRDDNPTHLPRSDR